MLEGRRELENQAQGLASKNNPPNQATELLLEQTAVDHGAPETYVCLCHILAGCLTWMQPLLLLGQPTLEKGREKEREERGQRTRGRGRKRERERERERDAQWPHHSRDS
jgi:hypothetical protein